MKREQQPTRIILVRHGESWANKYGIIISKPEHSSVAGLTPKGEQQIRRATRIALREGTIDKKQTIVYSSQLRRCRESATIITEELGLSGFHIRQELNERNFGNLEFGDHDKYALVYQEDTKNPDHHLFGVESVAEVQQRASKLLGDIEKEYEGKTVVLVTHKDVAEILQTALEGFPPERHRDRTIVPRHANGEFRILPTRRSTIA